MRDDRLNLSARDGEIRSRQRTMNPDIKDRSPSWCGDSHRQRTEGVGCFGPDIACAPNDFKERKRLWHARPRKKRARSKRLTTIDLDDIELLGVNAGC